MKRRALLIAFLFTPAFADPAGPPLPPPERTLLAQQAIAHAAAGDRIAAPCTRRAGEITVCGTREGRSDFRLPLPDAHGPHRFASEPAHIGIGDSPARVAPGVGLTLTVPIGSVQAPAGKAMIQGTADATAK